MRDSIAKSEARVTRRGFDFSAGDVVIIVPPENPLTITGATKATPLVVAAENDLIENARVTIAGVQGNTAANGTFRARSVSHTHLSLYSEVNDPIVGNDNYIRGGTLQHAPTTVLSIKWNNPRISAEGLEIDAMGLSDGQECILRFLNQYLVAQGIPRIEPDFSFLILGERWDPEEKYPIQRSSEAGGLALTTTLVIRKAVELNNSEAQGSGLEWASS
jgi:hypothetical protein